MEKKLYESLKEIKTRINTGQTTTFAERNYLARITKKEKNRRIKTNA